MDIIIGPNSLLTLTFNILAEDPPQKMLRRPRALPLRGPALLVWYIGENNQIYYGVHPSSQGAFKPF